MKHILATLALTLACTAPAAADEEEMRVCLQAVAELRAEAMRLPAHDLSRRFIEADLAYAIMEADAGDVDECPALIERATATLRDRPYMLHPGETLKGYGPDDIR